MKNRKSALRKAVMAAMLAGAITTTGGVKANELDGVLKPNSDLAIELNSIALEIDKSVKNNRFNVITLEKVNEILKRIDKVLK
ncbi:TPA: peptidase, partial [Streptococcus equi subsp. zooepidemicus]|nr:peptidase [Streptococcus equi subsp. zooepidemicus]